ncbi:MAG: hypothetical protein FJ272_07440 [Planctomycetes bacterium]|nr:hypothetical protein [Planctomycetota bacterium]
MAATNLLLQPEEQALLIRILEASLGEARAEVRRTHYSPDFRELVKREESLIRGLLEKVRKASA